MKGDKKKGRKQKKVVNSSYSLGFVFVPAFLQYENMGTDAELPRPIKPILPWRAFCLIWPPILGNHHMFLLNSLEFRYLGAEDQIILFWMFSEFGVFAFVFSKGQVM